MKKKVSDFISQKPHVSFIAIVAVCLGIGFAVTHVEANISEQSSVAQNNPHRLPNEFNPRVKRPEDMESTIAALIPKQELAENEQGQAQTQIQTQTQQQEETIHSMALKDHAMSHKPILDFTTGTSN